MPQPDFDWTIDDAPLEGEARPPGGGMDPQRLGLIPPARRVRKPWPRWAWLTLSVLAATALLAGYLFTRLGWWRLEQQIAAEVAYDDARSRAREVEAVLAAQAPNDPNWRSQRTAEVELGLPAPLPAGNLLPTAYPAEVIAVEPLDANVFAATVRRRYADSAGQVFAFDLVQRYHNLAPGEWQRLSTDYTGLVAATIVQGARLSATVPTNDLPWLKPALVAADAVLLDACAAWQTCPDGYALPLAFNVGAEALHPSVSARSAGAPSAAYPIIFDLAARPPGYPPRYVLSAPQVAGRPADAAAQTAYNRALSVRLLGYMAAVAGQSTRGNQDYFLDAIVARMEVRLGLSQPAPAPFAPLTFASAATLWGLPELHAFSTARTDLADRRQVFDLLNVVLQDQPPEVDGALLRALHRADVQSFDDWVAAGLDPEAAASAAVRWVAAAQQHLGQPTPDHDWAAAEGLVLLCPDSVSVVAQGVRRQVAAVSRPPDFYGTIHQRSGGAGRYLAVTYYSPPGVDGTARRPELWMFDLEAGGALELGSAGGYAVGWDAADVLYYLPFSSDDSAAGAGNGLLVQRYDPASGQTTTLVANLYFASFPVWSADRRSLVFTQASQDVDTGSPTNALVLLTLGPPATVRPLVEQGYAPAFAPGSTATQGMVAYLRDGFYGGPVRGLEVHLLDLATGADRVVFDNAQAGGPALSNGTRLLWSPGGMWLAFAAYGDDQPHVFTVAPATGQWREWALPGDMNVDGYPIGFAADDGYLAMQGYNPFAPATYALFDLNAGGSVPTRLLVGSALAWAPTGHTLALTNDLGVFLVDAATGDYQWLQAEPCELDW